MEFVDLSKYRPGDRNKPIEFTELKRLPRVRTSQELIPCPDKENMALLDRYAAEGLKVVPITRIAGRDLAARKDFPNRVLLEMTSRCNLQCRMCPRHNLTRPHLDFDASLFKKILDEIDMHGVEGVWLFHLGEPVLHPKWKELVTYAGTKKNIGAIWFSSNGVAFDKDSADFVLDSKITFLNYSLHGTNEETFGFVSPKELYKRVRGNLEYILERKKELGRGPVLHIQMIDQDGTRDNINEFMETFYRTGEVVSINTLEYANLPNNAYGLARPRTAISSCKRLSRGDCFIVSNGDVQPCDNTYNSEILLGNVKTDSVRHIWNDLVRRNMADLNSRGRLFEIERCGACTDYDL